MKGKQRKFFSMKKTFPYTLLGALYGWENMGYSMGKPLEAQLRWSGSGCGPFMVAGGGCKADVIYLHHFNPLLALSCQPQVLHTVSGNCIPGRAKTSLDVLLRLSHLLLWLQLLMGRRLSCSPGHSSIICQQAQVSIRISEFFVSWKWGNTKRLLRNQN